MVKYSHEFIPKEMTSYKADIIAIVDMSAKLNPQATNHNTVKDNIQAVLSEICEDLKIVPEECKVFYSDTQNKWQAYDTVNKKHIVLDFERLLEAIETHLNE